MVATTQQQIAIKPAWGARLLKAAVMSGLLVMTVAAAYQTWKQVMLPDFRQTTTAAASPTAVPAIDWTLLRELDYKSGAATAALAFHHGKRVRVPGFAVPLEDHQSRVAEFLLVPFLGACIHTPPPPPNQIVHVRTTTAFDVSPFDPIWVTGELRISTIRSPYGDVAFQLTAVNIEPYRDNP
jgi:uncharacterized protein